MAISIKQRLEFRRKRVREVVYGTTARPRLSVHRSNKHIYAQVIDDSKGRTLASASSQSTDLKGKLKSGGTVSSAEKIGKLIAENAIKVKVDKVVFDRGGKQYHGVIKALADSARKGGLIF